VDSASCCLIWLHINTSVTAPRKLRV